MDVTVAKEHLKDSGSDQINLTSENAYLKNSLWNGQYILKCTTTQRTTI